MRKELAAHLSLLTVGLIYGASYAIAKLVMPYPIGPFAFILMRVGVSTALFWLASYAFMHQQERITKSDFIRLAWCSLFGVALNMLLFFKGLAISSPINASIIMVTTPLFVLSLAIIRKQEAFTIYKLLGIGAGTIGSVLLILATKSGGANSLLGNLYILLNAISFAIYLVLVKPLLGKYKAITIGKWVFLFANLVTIPVGVSEFSEISWQSFTLNTWVAMWFILVATTFVVYLLNAWALGKIAVSTVGAYIYIQPIMATFFAILLNQDAISLEKVIYASLIFLGVYAVNVRPKSQAVME